jgi:hypothetical protein
MKLPAIGCSALLLAACGPEQFGVSRPPVPSWRAELAATFTPPPDSDWVRVKAVIADREGNAYVLDEGASQIRVFDSTGTPRRVIGRRGAGPAEFAPAYGMGLGWIGDTLAVLDPGNGRLSRLTPDGRWVDAWPVKRITGRAMRLDQASLGAVYAFDSRRSGQASQSLLVGYHAGGPTDSIVLPERPSDQAGWITCPVHGGIKFFDVPFAWTVLSTAGPAGELVTARTDAYRIAFVSPKGDTLRTISRDIAPVVVSDSEWTAGLEEYTDFRAKNPAASCDPASPTRIRLKPILRDLVFDDAGNLWVEYRSAEGDMLDLFDRAGKLIGTLSAPAHDADIPIYVRGDRLYVVTLDEATGAQAVTVYRVVRQ